MIKKILSAAIALFFILNICQANLSPATEHSEYKLQPLDVLTITVHGQPDLTTKTRITRDGYITFPLLGKVEVKGLTVQELESKLKALLEKDYLVNAQVVAFIEEYHPRQVSVIGEVEKPGKYDMPKEKDLTLLEAIAMAGGFTKHANINNTAVMRMKKGERETIKVRVKDIIDKGEMDKDILLEPGDVITVPEPQEFSVMGEVEKPGRYAMSKEKATTLLDAVSMAGGFTKHADINNAKVIRIKDGKREIIKVRVKDIIDKGEIDKDIVIEPDDVISVPEPREISVMGEVEKPGRYEMPKEKQMTLLDAIAIAGGFTKHSDENNTTIIRVKNGKRETIKVRVKDIIGKGEKDKDIPLEPDDVVSVPESIF